MSQTNRRVFMMQVAAAPALLAAGAAAHAQAMVDEKDPAAANLGYKADATKVDKAKYKQYAAGQTCANCALYQPATQGCPLFAGKKVAAKGWCTAWAKKA